MVILFKFHLLKLAGLLFFTLSLANAHRSLPSGISCGSQFGSPNDALVVPNPAVSWANYHIYTCDDPIMWYEVDAVADQIIYMTITVPVIERFNDARMTAALIGPGLPSLGESDATIPNDVKVYAESNQLGAIVFQSPDDQSTCDHLTSSAMIRESNVKDGRCIFYERFTGSNLWVLMDDFVAAPQAGKYKIAVYEETGSTAKASFACCDWPEDFVTRYVIPDTDCPACGASPSSNPAWLSLFFEHKTMEQFGGYPPLQNCVKDSTPILLPDGDKCPQVSVSPVDQPESCQLGCDSTGECHSHNVFGECTHLLDWSITPMFGEAPVNKVIIFKGDKIRFTNPGTSGMVHNLYELQDENDLKDCTFDRSSEIAGVEDISIGYDVAFERAGTYYFTCEISCNSEGGNPGGDCHCLLGQKLTVEVKDASDGLRCHEHEMISKTSASNSVASAPLDCPTGNQNARTVNNPGYGARNENECAELCAPPIAISFMAGVDLGSCIEIGFTFNPTTVTVRPPGSPIDVDVRVTSNIDDSGDNNSNCHCHSYEQISCEKDDMLYDEHIEEITEYCTGILDGSEESCPYKCFQPMEVFHLHYLECPSRSVNNIYKAVNATQKCHIAATPAGNVDCPTVTLGRSCLEAMTPGCSKHSDCCSDVCDKRFDVSMCKYEEPAVSRAKRLCTKRGGSRQQKDCK